MDSDRFSRETARVGEFRRRIVRHVQCRSCGYEPPRDARPPYCPKCGGGCFEQFVQVGKLRADPPACRGGRRKPVPRAREAPAAVMEVQVN